MAQHEIRYRPDTPLSRCELKNSAIVWPVAIDYRLTQLVRAARGRYAPVHRKVLLAAIVAGVEPDADRLIEALVAYDVATVGKCSIPSQKQQVTIPLPRREPLTYGARTPLHECSPKAAAVIWPLAVDHRLDALVGLVDADNGRLRRNRLAAALVLACQPSKRRLHYLLDLYDGATVGVARLQDTKKQHVSLRRHGPGPRPGFVAPF